MGLLALQLSSHKHGVMPSKHKTHKTFLFQMNCRHRASSPNPQLQDQLLLLEEPRYSNAKLWVSYQRQVVKYQR